MSYAIIRNAKYKASQLNNVSRHNERKNKNYGNKDIDINKSNLNYHFKAPKEISYEKEFYRLREENNLKGNLRLTGNKQSNIMCEFMITSDNDFFNNIGEDETKRFFKTAYDFACKKCDEKNIISATVHMDETTPHMHLTYIPVVKGVKKGVEIDKINASEFWKGFNSYGKLQDEFYDYVNEMGFNLERGETKKDREHLSVEEYKIETKLQELENNISSRKEEVKDLDFKIESKKTVLSNLKQGNDCLHEDIKYKRDGSEIKMDYFEFRKFQTQIASIKKVKKENEDLKNENTMVHRKCTGIMESQNNFTDTFTNWINRVHDHLPIQMREQFKRRSSEALVDCETGDYDEDSTLDNAVMNSKAFNEDVYIKCTDEKENALKESKMNSNGFEMDW
ncbi:MobV family relaxase (plasmid) [Clostridium sp. FAM 1755]|uniref:MobV family relaxase n=1 Tax=Clostridium caseinilyticum TaxID=3350403 RepID=UPI0038F7B416